MNRYLHVKSQDDGIAVIYFDDPQDHVNKLSGKMLSELEQALLVVEQDPTVRGLVLISAKTDNFVVGADLKELGQITQPGIAKDLIHRVHALFARIENLPCPVVAAIHGHCLGGGLELALACHYRIATDHPGTLLGLPEVKLGLLPAGGGTQRLTRLIGVRKGLPLILEGRALNAFQAKKLGVVDLVAYPYRLVEIASECISRLQNRSRERPAYPRFPSLDWALQRIKPARNLFFKTIRRQVEAKSMGNYPAPMRILECVETGLSRGLSEGLGAEAQAFDACVLSPESKSLRWLFFASIAVRKKKLSATARSISRVGILGGGLMGSGIATVTAQGGVPTVVKDISRTGLSHALKTSWEHFDRQVKTRRLRPMERDRIFGLIVPTLNYEKLTHVDLVIEAVFEDLALKRRVFRELEDYVHEECILASNTSAIPIGEIASSCKRPEMMVGMHYFSPVPHMPLLEIVVTPQTLDWVTATAVALGRTQGKTVIVVRDGPGFFTSRILSPYLHEALLLLHEWADVQAVDQAMRRFGFPVGPFKLLDEVGIDIATHVSEEIHHLFAPRGFFPPASLQRLLQSGYLGRKGRRGFYQYPQQSWRGWIFLTGARRQPEAVNRAIYSHFGGTRRRAFDAAEVQKRLVLLMVNEAVLCLQEGIIADPRDGDVGAILGLGFPPFLGGPFRYLDELGVERAVATMEGLAAQLGPRFQPAPLLVDMARQGRVFYENG